MSYVDRETLFIFFDESGNFDFSAKGSPYWSLTALCTFHPLEGREAFLDLAYMLADEGEGQEFFHATEDRQAIRDRVFELILQIPKNFDIHCAIAEKKKVPPALRKTDVDFYAYMCKRMLRYLVTLEQYKAAKRVVVIFSSIFTNSKHQTLIGELKKEIKDVMGIPYSIYFRNTYHDVNCQIADYCSWAISVKWTRQETRSYEIIQGKISSEKAIFGAEGQDYY